MRRSRALRPIGLAFAILVAHALLSQIAVSQPGAAWAWGQNGDGQLGDGTTLSRLIPVPTSGPVVAASTAAGGNHSLFVDAVNGTVWAVGYNGYGQLGDGSTSNRTLPVQVAGLSGVAHVAAGSNSSYALRADGTVWAWGRNNSGQLGNGSTSSRLTPDQVVGLPAIRSLSAGSGHCLALDFEGNVWAWGSNGSGRLGDNSTTNRPTPVQVLGLTDVAAIAAGGTHSLALLNDGTVRAWGSNSSGQLGDGTTTNRLTRWPVNIESVRSISAGSAHSLAVKSDGTVWGWGSNGYGQIGDGSTFLRTSPVQTLGLLSAQTATAGGNTSFAVDELGRLWGWGNGESGRLAFGTDTSDKTTPIRCFTLNGVWSVAVGGAHAIAVRSRAGVLDLDLLDLVTSSDPIQFDMEVYAPNNGALLSRFSDRPFVDRLYVPIGESGPVDIRIKGGTWLARRITITGDSWVENLGSIRFHNGDANNDNAVNVADFLALRSAFGSVPGSPRWNPNADFDRNGAVNIDDFLIVRKNFGRSGDS